MNFEPSRINKNISQSFFSKLDDKIQLIQDQETLINLAKGNPDLPTPDFIIDSLKKAVDNPQNHGYTPFDGKISLLDAISIYYKREYSVEIDSASEILSTEGSIIGISALPQVFLEEGDYVVTTDPCYPEYYTSVALAGGKLFQLSINPENDYLPDLSSLPEKVLKRTKILLLNYPNNPTGATATKTFFKEAIDFGIRNHILVINDFAYAAIGFDRKPISILQTPHAKECAIELNTLSKTYNMAGWRVGYIAGNESVISAVKRYHGHVYSTIFGAIQDAATTALLSNQESAKKIKNIYKQRRDILVNGLKNLGWKVNSPKGTFFVWVKVPQGYDSQSFSNLILNQANIVVAPGIGFGKSGNQFVRLSLTNDSQILQKVVQRLAKIHY